jgi:hypothetical protein
MTGLVFNFTVVKTIPSSPRGGGVITLTASIATVARDLCEVITLLFSLQIDHNQRCVLLSDVLIEKVLSSKNILNGHFPGTDYGRYDEYLGMHAAVLDVLFVVVVLLTVSHHPAVVATTEEEEKSQQNTHSEQNHGEEEHLEGHAVQEQMETQHGAVDQYQHHVQQSVLHEE